MPNPYDFVPFSGSITESRRKPQHRHHRFTGHCGELACTLDVLTPLFTAIQSADKNGRLTFPESPEGRLMIVGSSLKGVFRNVAEAASPSCIRLSRTLLDKQGRLKREHERRLDASWGSCFNLDRLCPACRLFGMIGGRSANQDEDVHVFAGNVQIESAIAHPDRVRQDPQERLVTLMKPHDTHQSFYLKNGQIRGRKFYFHHTDSPQADARKSSNNKYIRPVLSGSQFEFSVHFRNLVVSCDDPYPPRTGLRSHSRVDQMRSVSLEAIAGVRC